MSLTISTTSPEEDCRDDSALISQPATPANASSSKSLRVGFLRRQIDIEDGITSHCKTLIGGLKSLGVEVVMMTGPVLSNAKSASRVGSLKSMVSNWVDLEMPRRRYDVRPRHVSGLARQIRDNRIDVIHLHGMGTLLLARAAARATGIPMVATVHLAGGVSTGAASTLLRSMRAMFRRIWPERLIAISTEIQRTFTERWGVPPDRIDVIPNGISTADFRPPTDTERDEARRQFGLTRDHFVVAHVGRLIAVKGHDVLFRAVAAMSDPADRLRILCIGTGEKAEELAAMARSLGIASKIQFLGYRDPLHVYWAADVLALPSRNEGFPIVVVEAMACGAIPIRTPAAGAFDQISDGLNGYLFPFEDDSRLAELLSQLMADPMLCSRLKQRAIETARERFDVSVMASRTVETYRSAISAHAGR